MGELLNLIIDIFSIFPSKCVRVLQKSIIETKFYSEVESEREIEVGKKSK
jgi:hypothetical protein